jgi:hypothetical protein
MRCDSCGCDIAPGQGVETTRSEQTGPAGPLGAGTTTDLVTICPRCARRRAAWTWVAGIAVAVLFFGGLAFIVAEVWSRL